MDNEIITSIDIGTTKIAVIIAEKNNNSLNILGFGEEKSKGLGDTIEKITASDIEKIKVFYKGRISDNGINIILSRMRALLNWCRDIKEIISVCPKIKLIKTVDNIPTYFTESDLNAIITTDVIDVFYKNISEIHGI